LIVEAGKLAAWKDLPSENWAEMMEFWHCHKPEPQHHETKQDVGGGRNSQEGRAAQESLTARGYGANAAITAQRGVGFVDVMAFSFAEDDCLGLTVRCALLPLTFPLPFGWVSRRWSVLAFRRRWHDHRYKCPRTTVPISSGIPLAALQRDVALSPFTLTS